MTTNSSHTHEPRTPGYCPMCGGALELRDLPGDGHPRLVCSACLHVHYLNPKIVGATLPVIDGRVLLIRRAIEPCLGAWTYPAGFIEFGESAEDGAIRETLEEACVEVAVDSLVGVYSRPQIGIVVVVYLATIIAGEAMPGAEALETAWFRPHEIPWDDLAFDTTEWALRDWVRSLGVEEPR